ncbi:MFS transporter, partial [Streptosporangium sp. NPDC048865]|uniref:MFS transporter n=1 Tax=Streptosporangium sp. NPDC048865 TaxID=3155766 RepID=UPI00343AB3C6
MLLVAVDATVLNLAIPAITTDLNAGATQMLWILDVYSLVLAGLLVSAGALSDRLGRRRVLLFGCALFGVASAAAAYAPSAEALIAARVLMGIGGATIMPSTLAIVRSVFEEPRERTLAIGLWSAMAAAGAAVGPILGGVLLERFWWGSVFLVNVPILLVLLVVGALVLPELRGTTAGRWDWPGAGASMVGLVALVLAIKEIAAEGLTATTVAAALTAALALSWFVRRQLRTTAPLLNVRMFRHRAFTGAVLGNLIALLALSGLLLFLSQHLQLVDDLSPLEAGVCLLPLTLGALIGAPLAAGAVRRAGAGVAVSGGLALAAVGMVGFSLTLDAPFAALAAAMAALGAGVGLALTATSDAIVSAAPPEKAGSASSISETAYELGTGLGIAVLGSVLAALYTAGLPAGLPGDSLAETLALAPTAAAAGTA